MGIFKQIGEYLWIGKKDKNRPKSFNLSVMHGINRISILLFLLCIVIIIARLLRG